MPHRGPIFIEDIQEPYPLKNRTPLDHAFPQLVASWHRAKNCGFGPDEFSPGSSIKAWWLCEQKHEYQTAISQRVRAEKDGNNSCPYCDGKMVCSDNAFEALFPLVAREWHPTKNAKLRPNEITAYSPQKAWWICEAGHCWKTAVANRTMRGSKCPFCVGKKASDEYNLLRAYPEIAAQWHPTRNKPLRPQQVTPMSNVVVWWQCKEHRDHVWNTKVEDRTNYKTGCPFCTNRRVSKTNSLATLFPEIAKEWHPTKNGSLEPSDVVRASNHFVWWKCKRGHVWQAFVFQRTSQGSSCPSCRLTGSAKRES